MIGRHPEYLQLHAAAMIRDGIGVVLAGASGSGKSTLAAGLLSRGWRYLSDELALIDPDTLALRGFPKALCVKRGAFDVLESLSLPLWRRRHYVKAFKGRVGYLNPRQVSAAAVGGSARVGFIVFPRYMGDRPPRLRPVKRAQALFSLQANMLNQRDFGPRSIPILGDLVRGAKCMALEVGALGRTCDTLERLVAGESPAACVG